MLENHDILRLSNELDNTTSFLDLALCILADVSCLDDERYTLREASLSENLAVAEGEEVKNWCGVLALVGEELLPLLEGDKRPELSGVSTVRPRLDIVSLSQG